MKEKGVFFSYCIYVNCIEPERTKGEVLDDTLLYTEFQEIYTPAQWQIIGLSAHSPFPDVWVYYRWIM